MDEITQNTVELCLKEWTENSLLFRDREKWLEELKQELAEIPRLEEEIKALNLKIDLHLQSLLLDEGLDSDEVFELMGMPATAIDIIDSEGGSEEWRKNRRKQHFQPSSQRIL